MGLFQVVCMGLLATVGRSQELQNCSFGASPLVVGSTEDAAALASSLRCSNGDIAVEWVGEVFVEETIFVMGGTSLNITGAGPGAVADGGGRTQLFSVNESASLYISDMTLSNGNNAISSGGAIDAFNANVSLGGNVSFISNSANYGGAISMQLSDLYGDVGGSRFVSNFANSSGGAIHVRSAAMSWDGDGAVFSNNSAGDQGGAIYLFVATVLWTVNDNYFSSNYAGADGGAIFMGQFSDVSWGGNNTLCISNSAGENGGAIYVDRETDVFWDGIGTEFSNNSAGRNGGALHWTNHLLGDVRFEPFIGTAFTNNSAGIDGGAIYVDNFEPDLAFAQVTFKSNSAGHAGGAFAAYDIGDALFAGCNFSDNKAVGTGGAVDIFSEHEVFSSCEFKGNSADVGGAMRTGGTTDIADCSFLSNSATSRAPAVAVLRSAAISFSSFDSNELYCKAGSYRHDTEQENSTARFAAVCLDCPDWDECVLCTMTGAFVTSTCEEQLGHTSANQDGVTLESLNVDEGYWRATSTSEKVLACYNADACSGGQTGADSFCAPGYNGPYCAVCETDYAPSLAHTCTRCSSSRRQGLVAATVLAALVVVVAVLTIFMYLLSTEVEEENIGSFRRRVLRAVPVQGLKIILVVWQILTQFADAANVTYPGVYQDFLSAIDVINFDLGSMLTAGCLWSDIDFHDRLLVNTIGPLVVVGFLGMTYLIAVRRNGASIDAAALEKIRRKHQTALLLVTFLVYSSVSSTVFQTFACDTLDDDIEYLRADYRIECTSAKHEAFEVYAGFMIFMYPVGIPLLYAVLLFQRRHELADAGAPKTVAQSTAALWEPYRPQRFYYEVVECGRRIMLTGVVVFIFPNDAAQIATTILIVFFFVVVFEVSSPYTSESDMWLSRGGHVIVFLSMFDLLLLRVDVSRERDQSQAAFAAVLVAGHVLMILAIVVEVVGVCFASRTKKVVEGEEPSETLREGSDDMPVFESAPASRRSFFRQRSVSEKAGPTRSVSAIVVTTGGGA